VFLALAPWWPTQESDRTKIWSAVISPRGTYVPVQSFRAIAPAVTKRTLLMDNDDRQHVIVELTRAKKDIFQTGLEPSNCIHDHPRLNTTSGHFSIPNGSKGSATKEK
jgi:hypothetical protein